MKSTIYSSSGGFGPWIIKKSSFINIDGTAEDWDRLQVLIALHPDLREKKMCPRPTHKRKQRLAHIEIPGPRGKKQYAITVDELIQRLAEAETV